MCTLLEQICSELQGAFIQLMSVSPGSSGQSERVMPAERAGGGAVVEQEKEAGERKAAGGED